MTIGRITTLIAIFIVVGYVGFHIRSLVSAPELTLLSPPEALTTSEHTITIQGKTEHGAHIEINGDPIPPPASGDFEHTVVLSKGLNNLTITARKRHSKATVIERQVYIIDTSEYVSQVKLGGT